MTNETLGAFVLWTLQRVKLRKVKKARKKLKIRRAAFLGRGKNAIPCRNLKLRINGLKLLIAKYLFQLRYDQLPFVSTWWFINQFDSDENFLRMKRPRADISISKSHGKIIFFLFCRYLASFNKRHRDIWGECARPQPLASTEYTTALFRKFLHLLPYTTRKMSRQILRCDWLHERERERYLARSSLTTVSRNKSALFFIQV